MFDFPTILMADTRLKKSGANWYAGACPFCGGHDRFVLKQTSKGWVWLCRRCSPKYRDEAGYLMRRDHIRYREALQRLGQLPHAANPSLPHNSQSAQYQPPAAAWQELAHGKVHEGMLRLSRDKQGRAKAFLAQRGIQLAAMLTFYLGFEIVHNRPALLIPSFLNFETILSIKYRFLDGKEPRYRNLRGGRPLLFNLIDVHGGDTLFLCEGELNAISLWQVRQPGWDVISTGSEHISQHAVKALRKIAPKYRQRVVWYDSPEKTSEASSLFNAHHFISSPLVQEVKCDANEMLQRALLSPFLQSVLQGESF